MKMSYEQLKQYVANVVTAGKISVADFNVTRNNSVGLLDKIGKIVTLDTNYETDKLNIFDGEYLSFGKTIEEWQEDLILPVDPAHPATTSLWSPFRSRSDRLPPFWSLPVFPEWPPARFLPPDLPR